VAKERRIFLSDSVANQNERFDKWQPFDIPSTGPAAQDNFAQFTSTAFDVENEDEFKDLFRKQDAGSQNHGFVSLYQPSSEVTPTENSAQEESSSPEISTAEEEEKLQKLADQAYEEGFAKGEQDGLEDGRHQVAEVLGRINELLGGIENLWPDLVQTYEKQLVDLVFKAAEKVVLGQIAVDSEVVKRSILQAFDLIPDPVQVTVEVHPDDYEFIETVKVDFFDRVKSLKQVTVISDASVRQGGCRVHTPKGRVNATLESRLEAVSKSITGTYATHDENDENGR
jgi:flagellar assembly protein FliH